MALNANNLSIPVIDFNPLLVQNTVEATACNDVAKKLYDACTSVGFFFAKNIGISDDEVMTMFQLSKRFFSLPQEVKAKIAWDKSNRGWVAFQREALDPVTNPTGDPKEALNFGPKNNRYISELEDMERIVMNFFEKARQASLVILEGYALALSLDRHFFYQNHMGTETATTLRCLYYPSRPYGNDKHLRAGIHTDYGSITLLWQDGVKGLEVEHPITRQWISVEPVKGSTCVVNTGDLERYSVAFFVHPDDDCVVETFPSCRNFRKDVYPPVRADEYFRMKLNATY